MLRRLNATPHVAQNISGRSSRIDRRTVRHPGYLASQRARKRVEEAFAWIKTIAGQAKTSFRGTGRVGWAFTLAAAGPSCWASCRDPVLAPTAIPAERRCSLLPPCAARSAP